MFITLLIFFFLLWEFSSYLLFKISPLKRDSQNKILKVSALVFIFLVCALFIIRNYYSTLEAMEPIYIGVTFLLTIMFYLVVLSPITFLTYLYLKKQKTFQKTIFFLVIITALVLTLLGFLNLYTTYKITTLNIPTENSNLIGKRFVFLADPQFSVATQVTQAKRITHILEQLKPDNIFIAGDLFNGEKLNWEPLQKEMQKWSNVAPVYMVTGNHEFYGDYNEFIKLLEASNFHILKNETLNLDGVNILGMSFAFNKVEKNTLNNLLLTELKNNQEDIVFMHEPPYDIAKEISSYSPTLVFSGHTHNGQFWPLNYLVRLKYGKFIYGQNILASTTFYTTSGFGISLIPNRLFNKPEIVLVNFLSR